MVTKTPRISIIAAMSAHDRAIGCDGKLLWRIADDLKRFKELTLGNSVIMGRKTFQSIVEYIGGPLPNRENLIITRSPENISNHPVMACSSFEEAFEKAREISKNEIFIGGGGEIYSQALPYTDRLYLTLIDDEQNADTFFPPYEHIFTEEIEREKRKDGSISYCWVTLEKQ